MRIMSTFPPSSGVQSAYPSVPAPTEGHGAGVGDGRNVNYNVVVIVVILSVVFILSGFLHLLAHCLGPRRRQLVAPRQHSRPLASALHGQLQHLFHLHDAGVEQAFINTLPVFAYGSIRGLKDSADCAVCLNEFADDDRLRLLPKCKHAFHLECIDIWLLSHSTCPLCRRNLLPDHPLAHGTASSSSHRRHGDLPSAEMPTEMATSASDMTRSNRLTCPEEYHPQHTDSRSAHRITTSLHGSIHGSYHNSFRMCDALPSDRDSQNEIQEIEEPITEADSLKSTPSPVAPTIRVVDEHGTERVLKVELGRVAACRVMSSHFDSRKLTKKGARSYSMGSYEYIVDPASWELMIAPTPYPGRPQDWAPSKPSHRSAFSDSIPELASWPANDELFWASRGLHTPQCSLPRVRALLTPIMSSDQSNAGSSQFLDHSYSPGQAGDRWIDIDIERGEAFELTDPPFPTSTLSTSSSSPALELAIEVSNSTHQSSDRTFKQDRATYPLKLGCYRYRRQDECR